MAGKKTGGKERAVYYIYGTGRFQQDKIAGTGFFVGGIVEFSLALLCGMGTCSQFGRIFVYN